MCVCLTFAHVFRCIDKITYMYVCICTPGAQLHLLVPETDSTHNNPGSVNVCVSGGVVHEWCMFVCVLCAGVLSCVYVCAWDRVSQVFFCRSEINLLVGTGNPLTVATAERYKIRANSFLCPQVTDRMRERERVYRVYCNFLADKKTREKALMDGRGDG